MNYKTLPSDDGCVGGKWEYKPKAKKVVEVSSSVAKKTQASDDVDAQIIDVQIVGDDEYLEKAQRDKRALCCSIVTMLFSIPALIGAWCWPALVIGLIGGTVTAAARQLGHWISFGVTLAMMIGLCTYVGFQSRSRRGSTWQRMGPFILCVDAAMFIMMDLTRHVLQDIKVWPAPGSSEYRSDCDSETIACLSPIGWVFTIFATYSGFILLVIGTMWNANICDKIADVKEKWKELRS